MDKDFGALVYQSGLSHEGVLLLRMEDATGEEKAAAVGAIVVKHGARLLGSFSVFQSSKLRVTDIAMTPVG